MKRDIEVREGGVTVKTIRRVIWGEAIGNFNPIFCRFNKNNRVLVKADEGDLSDPFRREESYTLFIDAPQKVAVA